jgi:error-prone DNA polymerase
MMAVIEDSLALIRDAYGEEVDLAHLPQDDPAVYDALQRADTIGMFQVESRAQMSCLPRLCPKKFYDIVVQVAIIRPGPIVGKMVNPYLKRRQGRERVEYMHPSLEPVLKRTLGVPLFQEQLLRMAMIAASFSGGEAEELRRAFGFKRSERRMQEIEVKLRRGMERNGITGRTQDAIVESIASFALYGFPESHAASFALLAYASAYLKCHYLAAFTAALLNNQPMGFYHSSTIIKDAQRHGLKIKPIDVAHSGWLCTIEEEPGMEMRRPENAAGAEEVDAQNPAVRGSAPVFKKCLRLGLRYVKGLRQQAAEAIVRERAQRPFTNIDDLARRVPELRQDEIRRLAEIGALNSIGAGDRRDALWQAQRAVRPAGPLLDRLPESDSASPLRPMTPEERLLADFRSTGLTIGPHPMAYRRAEMDQLRVSRAVDLRNIPDGRPVRVAGCVIARQRPGTAKGFLFLSLEDESGIANAIVAPDLFEGRRLVLVNEPFLLIDGVLQNQDGVVSVKAQRVQPLAAVQIAAESHDFH